VRHVEISTTLGVRLISMRSAMVSLRLLVVLFTAHASTT